MEDVKVRTRTGAFRAYIRSLVNKNWAPIRYRSDFGLSCDHPVVYSYGVPRLPACQHRYVGRR